jgi:hypothetical protein
VTYLFDLGFWNQVAEAVEFGNQYGAGIRRETTRIRGRAGLLRGCVLKSESGLTTVRLWRWATATIVHGYGTKREISAPKRSILHFRNFSPAHCDHIDQQTHICYSSLSALCARRVLACNHVVKSC